MAYKADIQQGGTLTATNKIQFNDSGVFMHSDSDGSLIIQSDDAIALKGHSVTLARDDADGVSELRFSEDSDNGSNYVGFKAAATLGGNQVWQLPTADAGATGYALVSDGSGVLSWADVSSTLNIDGLVDGTGVTIADGDRLALSDNGTEKYIEMSQLETYMETSLDTLSNVTTVGALNAGSITSGFTSIDVGAGAISTTGLGSFGSLDVDDVLINGTTIGHTDDTDLMTLANGALTVAGTITVGVDDAGHDVKFFGDTASAYMLWDTSVDDLILGGAARVVVPDSQLVLGNTAVTSTAAELNLLDGVSGLVQADFTKLAAVDSTSTELNLMDGGSSIGTTAVSDGHGIVMNHGGTMAQTTVQTLAAYLDDEITAMPNLVTTAATTVGALNAGSITSGFGNIDIGASEFQGSGIVSPGGNLNIKSYQVTTSGSFRREIADNLSSAVEWGQGPNSYLKFISTNGGEAVLVGQALDISHAVRYSGMYRVAANAAIASSASVILAAAPNSGDLTLTLPTPTNAIKGHTIVFKRIDANGARKVVLNRAQTSNTIDGGTAEVSMDNLAQALTLMCMGSGSWAIL